MATTTFTTMIPTPSAKTTAAKRPGPPVPPRPQQSSLLRTQHRDAVGASATNMPQRSSSKVGLEQPQILKKPAPVAATMSGNAASGGRTVIYKSPSLNLQKRQEEREKRGGESQGGGGGTSTNTTTKANAVTQTATSTTAKLANGTHAPKPPLKLRKAPDVPTAKARIQPATDATTAPTQQSTTSATTKPAGNVVDENRDNNNIVIVQSSQGSVTLNRHHSMNTPSTHTKPPTSLKDSRLSLGRADFERVGNKINLSHLQPTTQPLPRPRKIVKIPVATIDMEDTNSVNSSSTTTSSSSNSHGVGLFKRSKTTLDNFTSRAHITTVSTGTAGGYLSGKTVEIKNNLKNAAERLFSEIMVNQQKHGGSDSSSSVYGLTNMVITKHERAIQHQTVVETGGGTPSSAAPLQNNVTVVNTANEEGGSLKIADNCTRINIITTTTAATPTHNTTTNGQEQQHQHQQQHIGVRQVVSAFNSPEKKSAAFHEMLISELAAMRTRSCSMENLQTKSHSPTPPVQKQEQQQQQQKLPLQFSDVSNKTPEIKNNNNNKKMQDEQSNPDDDIDADNVEDADGDEGEDDGQDIENALKKSLKVINGNHQNSPRKRTPSGCSSDSSPYGTERSSRIRTSDWIEVGDNGKQVTLTSCHISLEDSGLEDEERMDEMSSSGVGDSWDSVKEAEQYHHQKQQQQEQHQQQQQQHQQQQTKRNSRSVKRIMSINDLPPLPKSLSGINKMLASDSGLISDVDTEMARNAKNSESQKENNNINNNNSNNNNNNISIKDTGDKLNNSTLIMAATTTSTASAVSASATETTTIATTTTTPLKEINGNETISEIPPAIPGSKLDNQIATLRKEMFGLRQLDLTLLSQLWALNDSIQEFRTMIQENEQEDDETYSTHSRSPSPYDSVSSDGDDEISALKGKKLLDMQNANGNANATNVITTQPKLTPKSYAPENETSNKLANNRQSTMSAIGGGDMTSFSEQKSHLMKPPLPKPLDVKPVPRMRSAPPPPPTHRKSQNAPPRPT
ncbi:uncharacterized protein [Musca autumnalis]|uniref:uncharacterized protein n=1 Tax=Musca autumnalis TaxID=221902 RepID=UPI003CF25895